MGVKGRGEREGERSTSRSNISCVTETIMTHNEDGADIDAVAFYETLPRPSRAMGRLNRLNSIDFCFAL